MLSPEFWTALLIYVPISIIGLWRWTFWVVRRVAATMYRPNVGPWPADKPRLKVSVITPVYNEDPEIFEKAMQSWIANGVHEIIAVIDKTNTRHIVQFEKKYASNKALKTKCRLLVTPKPGKRAALCDGIGIATGDLITLVDSDTIWDHDVVEKTMPYFLQEQVGGATLTQRIYNPNNTANVLFDILLWSRYQEEVPFLLGVGKAFNTLSGRTAFYRREALLSAEYDNLHHLRHEFFLGTRGISGDDKRLTHLILEQGWHTAYVLGPRVYTPGLSSLRSFFKQRLRWTRNSWRADLRAIGKAWVWKHPALAIFMIDRFIQPFFMLIGPVVFTFAIVKQEWLLAGILLAWWLVSRFVRLFGYFRAHPKRLVYLPAYILYGYVNSVIKIYAFATLVEHTWATRWHATRLRRKGFLRKTIPLASGAVAIVLFFTLIGQFVAYARTQSGADLQALSIEEAQQFTGEIDFASKAPTQPNLPATAVLPTGVQRYTVQQGDSLAKLSAEFGISVAELKKLNGIRDPDRISTGQILLYYKKVQ